MALLILPFQFSNAKLNVKFKDTAQADENFSGKGGI